MIHLPLTANRPAQSANIVFSSGRVWVVNQDSKVEPRPVTVGQWYGDDWFINEGLTAGERVVVEGAVALSPGATVQVTQALAAGQPEAMGGAPK